MNSEILAKIVNKLNGLNWFFISGFAVEAYTNGKRKAKDIDIVLCGNDIDIFAKRINSKARKRVIDKGTFIIKDYGFETDFLGQEVEATNGYPIKRVEEKTFNNLFERKVKRNYLGCEIFLVPIEELIVHKASMNRKKDILDLELFKDFKIDAKFLKELANNWGDYDKIIIVLRNLGYNLT